MSKLLVIISMLLLMLYMLYTDSHKVKPVKQLKTNRGIDIHPSEEYVSTRKRYRLEDN